MQPSSNPNVVRRPKLVTALIETFGFSPWLASVVAAFLMMLGAAALLWVWLSAPPRSITITSGPAGSTFQRYAEKYREELATHGITLNIVPSGGSLDNLKALSTKDSGIDLAFVQGGLVGDPKNAPPGVVSLGTVAHQPLWVFTRGVDRLRLLSQLAGQRVGIGADGSGAQALARALLEANGITEATATLVEQPSEEAGKDFLAGKLDAIFLMGDSAPAATLRTLLRAPEVQVYDFMQADAYVRRLPYLNKIILPRGAIDLGHNLPGEDLTLIGPGVELLARKGLNSAVSDLLLTIARDVHGKATVLAQLNEFPAALEREFKISADAKRFYRSGQGFTYDLIDSFWLANLVNRLLVAIVPFFLVLIPAIRFFPVLYRWSVQLRIYRSYRPLLRLERDAETPLTAAHVEELLKRLDAIEEEVNALKVPASFAQQFYDLRTHIVFVRQRLKGAVA